MTDSPIGATEMRVMLAERIARLPRQHLAFLPTPVHEVPRLSASIGNVRVVVKRDDQTGLALGGNKTRMLEFTLGRAVADHADCIVAASYVDSNHCRQAAAAAARLGLPCHLVLGTVGEQQSCQGNLLLDCLLGARIEFVRANSAADISAAAAARVDALRAAGKRPFLVTYALEARALGTIAHVAAFLELITQLECASIHPESLYVSSGGNTYAGLLLGARLTKSNMRVVGIMPEGRREEAYRQVPVLMARAAQMLDIADPRDVGPMVDLDDAFLGPGYGTPSDAGNKALMLAAQKEGLLLDPIYTGKGMAGLIAHAQMGRIRAGHTAVFVHTGGGPALFEHAQQLGQLSVAG